MRSTADAAGVGKIFIAGAAEVGRLELVSQSPLGGESFTTLQRCHDVGGGGKESIVGVGLTTGVAAKGRRVGSTAGVAEVGDL